VSAALLKAIDDLLAFVDDMPIPKVSEKRTSFETLDRRVWVEACQRGYEGKLPAQISSDSNYLGKTNLPGSWTLSDFIPIGLHRWKNDMLALRDFAEAMEFKNDKQPAKSTNPAPLASDNEYVRVGELWPNRPEFKRYSDVTKFLNKTPEIRSIQKPRRRYVHESDWHRYFREKDRQASEQLDGDALQEQIADIEARKAVERQRKKRGK
jgi:hypothetical protein